MNFAKNYSTNTFNSPGNKIAAFDLGGNKDDDSDSNSSQDQYFDSLAAPADDNHDLNLNKINDDTKLAVDAY